MTSPVETKLILVVLQRHCSSRTLGFLDTSFSGDFFDLLAAVERVVGVALAGASLGETLGGADFGVPLAEAGVEVEAGGVGWGGTGLGGTGVSRFRLKEDRIRSRSDKAEPPTYHCPHKVTNPFCAADQSASIAKRPRTNSTGTYNRETGH